MVPQQAPSSSATATRHGSAGIEALPVEDAVIRLAGNSQDGIQTVGAFLAKLAGRTDQEVMTYMTIPSTISGGPSIFQVRLGSGEILSPGDYTDFLVAFYQHSYDNHISALREGGVCLYDSDEVKPDLDEARFTFVGVPLTSATVEALGGSTRDRGKNMFVLGLLTSIFNLNREKLEQIIARQFGRKSEDVLRNAMLAFDAGYAYPLGDILSLRYELIEGAKRGEQRVAMDGNQAMTLGLLTAGVRYGAGYPITPWSPIMETLRVELPKYGGLFVQSEDELGAVSTALGFAYSGHLAVTGSSGPGLSLKMEALGWATMAEMPLIVINVQRGGPSTGLPTNVEQSDLLQAIYGSHGDCPRVVLAPKDVEDCFYTAVEAARIARRYRVPVIILSDQALATRIEAFEEPDVDAHYVDPDLDLTAADDFKPYPLGDNGSHPVGRHAAPGTRLPEGKYPVVTGLEHDEWGHPTARPELHQRMTDRRRSKLLQLMEELPPVEQHGDPEGAVLLVGWGSTWGPILEAVKRLRGRGVRAGCVHLRHLHPMPKGLGDHFTRYQHVVVVEVNDRGLYGYGQLATLLRARHADPRIESLTKTDGLGFKVAEITDKVMALLHPEG